MKVKIKPVFKILFWLTITVGIFLSVSIPLGMKIWKITKINENFKNSLTNLNNQDQAIKDKAEDAQKINDILISDSEIINTLGSKKYNLLKKRIQEIKIQETAGFIVITDSLANTITESNENNSPLNLLEEYKEAILPLFRDGTPIKAVTINRLSRPVIIAGKAITVDQKIIGYTVSGFYFDQQYLKNITTDTNNNLGLIDQRGLIISSSPNGSEEQKIYNLSSLNFSLKELLNQEKVPSPIKKIISQPKNNYHLSGIQISLSGNNHPLWLISLKKEPLAQNMAKAGEPIQASIEGRLYLKMDQNSFNINQSGSITLMADSAGLAVNAVGAIINYRSDLMEVKGINFSESFCSIIVDKNINPQNGTVELSCGVPHPGISVSDKKVATLMVVAKQKGTADFSIDEKSAKMLINDGRGSNIFKYSSGAVANLNTTSPYSVDDPNNNSTSLSPIKTSPSQNSTTSSTTKKTTSTTKKNTAPAFIPSKVPVIKLSSSEKWCPGQTPFIWLKEDGVEEYEYELNTSMLEMKNPIKTTDTSVCLDIPNPEERYFFHIKAISGKEKSQMSIISIPSSKNSILSSIPKDSILQIETNTTPFINMLEDIPEISITSSTFNFFKSIGEGTFKLFGVL